MKVVVIIERRDFDDEEKIARRWGLQEIGRVCRPRATIVPQSDAYVSFAFQPLISPQSCYCSNFGRLWSMTQTRVQIPSWDVSASANTPEFNSKMFLLTLTISLSRLLSIFLTNSMLAFSTVWSPHIPPELPLVLSIFRFCDGYNRISRFAIGVIQDYLLLFNYSKCDPFAKEEGGRRPFQNIALHKEQMLFSFL